MNPPMMILLTLASHVVLTALLGWYFILLMQWYSYKFERVVLHHKKWRWHVIYFLIPFILYYATRGAVYYWVYFYLGFVPAFLLWYRRIDKKLVLTGRVKRFLGLLAGVTLMQDLLCAAVWHCAVPGLIFPLAIAAVASTGIEKYLFSLYYRKARERLASMGDLRIVAITASYGKTSIKNYLAQILSSALSVYATPRSVNTLGGLVKDVNEDLPAGIGVYVAEAGAREAGDIAEIAAFLEPHIAIVGQIGEQHIEYFKTLDAIRATKLELLDSPRLTQAIVHESAGIAHRSEAADERLVIVGQEGGDVAIRHVTGDLSGIAFELVLPDRTLSLRAPILGRFNATNIALAALCAIKLGLDDATIVNAVASLQGVAHRLQRLDAGGKVILDDSFNGNFEGMMEGVALCDTYEGRRVIVTPGIVESTDEANTLLGEAIDRVFDLVIITGSLNSQTLCDAITRAEKVRLRDKSKLTETLARRTKAGDLIYFANDAPNFI